MNARRLTMVVAALFVSGAVLIALGWREDNALGLQHPSWGILGQSQGSYVGGSLVTRSKASDGKREKLTYRWADPWSLRYVRWLGDTATVDDSREKTLGLNVTLRSSKVQEVIDSFGYAIPSLISYRTQEELHRKKDEIARDAAARGILINHDVCEVDYVWAVSRSQEDLFPVAESLAVLAKQKGYSTHRELLGIMASFVQSMTYKEPPDSRTDQLGRNITTVGFTMPLETLYNGWGDCDSKSALFASLVANMPDQRVIFFTGNSHLFVGVRTTPRLNDHYVNIRGIKYVLIEATEPWPIGRIPQDSWQNMRQFQSQEVVGPSVRQPATPPPAQPSPPPRTPQAATHTQRTPRYPPTSSTSKGQSSEQSDDLGKDNPVGILFARIVVFALLALVIWAFFRQFRTRPTTVKQHNERPTSTLQAMCNKVSLEVLGEHRRFCDGVARLWAVNRESLGSAFHFEVAAHLLYHLIAAMAQAKLLPDIRRPVLAATGHRLLGEDRVPLTNIIVSRFETYEDAARKADTAHDCMIATVWALKRNLDTCPDTLDELTDLPPRSPFDPTSDIPLLDGLAAIEAETLAFYVDLNRSLKGMARESSTNS